ncbi:MAG TPA: hypothetical protein VKA43_05430 [Gammaproteobacteria bacterium]|nr:hypothetical protein [Gammaproteobacteria bacterium]
MDNPYAAPTTPVKDPPPPPRSPILAVLAGVAVDIGGTVVASIVIGIVYAMSLASQGRSLEQVEQALTEADPMSAYYVVTMAVGFGFSVLGGYVCSRVARREERRYAAIAALLVVAIGLGMGGGSFSLWANIGMALLSFASVMLGGELGRRRNLAQARRASAATAA